MKLEEHPIVKRVLERSAAEAESDHVAPLDADWLRHLCLKHGADDVGFVEIDRPELAKDREDVLAVFPYTKTLIGFVCRMNREPIRSPARSVANLEFHHAGDRVKVAHRRGPRSTGDSRDEPLYACLLLDFSRGTNDPAKAHEPAKAG